MQAAGLNPLKTTCLPFHFQLKQESAAEPAIIVQIPPDLKRAAKNTNKVVCTFFQNNSLFQVFAPFSPTHTHTHTTSMVEFLQERLLLFVFQETVENARILDDVVEITVENEIISHLPEPIRIAFHHDVIPVGLHACAVAVKTTRSCL